MQKKLDRAFYDILSLTKDCTDKDIKKAFKKAALTSHPDKGGSDHLFQMVNESYNVLSDPVQRAEYDRDIKKFGLKDGQGLKTDTTF
jgi:DnaJ family protein A protein 2